MKKIFRILLLLFIGLIIALVLVPFVFKDQFTDSIKNEINKNINAEVDFADLNISLLKEFPALSVALDDFTITGVGPYEGENLLSAEKVDLGTDLTSLIKSSEGVKISSLTIDRPIINLVVDEKGRANYNITKENNSPGTAPSVFGEIEKYEINDGQLSYRDKQGHVLAVLKDIDHSGSGNFENVTFDLETETKIAAIDFSSGGISYLKNAKLNSAIDLAVDLDAQKYTFKENLTTLNNLDLAFLGDVQLKNEDIIMNLDVSAPNNKVSSILSLIPAAYNKDFASIQSEGNSFLTGKIKGIYNRAKSLYPKFNLKANIENGSIKYPELALPVKDINLDILINNNSADMSDLAVDVSQFTFLVNEDRMAGKVKVSNALKNPHVNGLLNGTLNLSNLNKAFPLEDITLNNGIIKTNMTIDANADDIINENYNAVKFNGQLEGIDLDLKYDNYPIKAEKMTLDLNPKNVNVSYINSYIGKSDFQGTARVANPLAFITDDAESKINLAGSSETLNLDELMSYSGKESNSDTLQDLSFYKKLDVTADYKAENVVYKDYKIEGLDIDGQYINNKLKLDNARLSLDKQKLALRGEATNVADYVFNDQILSGKFFMDAEKINGNKYLSNDSTAEEITEPFIVPDNLDISIYPEIGALLYENYLLNEVEGKIAIKDGIAELTESSAHTMGGKLILDGLYDSTNPAQPLFNLKYNMSGFDFSEVAKTSSSAKILAPLVSYINGLFNSTLVMSGPLGKDMMPDFTKVTASGFIETLEGQIKGFEPLEKVGNSLGIDKIKDWSLKGSKNWFDVKDGKVILKPHDHKVDDMTFTVGGTHSISQELDYAVKALIPRDKLKKDKLGKNLEFGMDYIEKEASSRGVNIDMGEMIYLDIFITGTIKNPKLKVIPVGSGGKTLQEVVKDEAIKQVNILKDTVTEELEKRTEVVKDTVTKVITAKVDTVKEQIKDKVKTEAEKQKDAIKDRLKDKLDTTVTKVLTDTLQATIEQKAEDILGTQAKSEIDSLKSKIKDWNPFKKKKN